MRAILLAACLGLIGPDPVPAAEPEGAREALVQSLRDLEAKGRLTVAGEPVPRSPDLERFYRRRGGEPAWSLHGYAGAQAWQLLDAIRASREDGLEPADYHEAPIDSLLRLFWRKLFGRGRVESRAYADLDILLTHAFLDLGAHILTGRHHPPALANRWHIHDEALDLPAHLEAALASGGDVRDILARLAPPYPEYGRLKAGLEELRRQLAAGGPPPLAEGQAALRRFQASHGLDTTGLPDAATRAEHAVPLEKRIGQVERALEYWRWLPRDLGPRHVRVNIADFRLGAYEGGREVLSRRVVLGSVRDRTPVFSDRMTALILNPSWTVPASIAREEILPELRKDPGYLARHDMELLAEGPESVPIPRPDSVDWKALPAGAFPFRLRQRPGPANPLGAVKFMLTNPFHVYLHDTPSPELFARSPRAFSHGCVRVEGPLELAAWALQAPHWTADSLAREIGKGKESPIALPSGGVPVHLLYWTTFVDSAGVLNHRRDVYGWERMLERALEETAAAPEPSHQ